METGSTADPRKRRILLIDDETEFLDVMATDLRSSGLYEVLTESDASLAVEKARQFRPDLVLLDVMMPEFDGGDVAAKLRADASTRNVPVLFLTALVGPQDADESLPLQRGGQSYFPKTLAFTGLRPCIDSILSHQNIDAAPPPERQN